MKYLLDTQVLIWWFESSRRLPREIKELIEGNGTKFVSVASFWEIIIKTQAKKLKLKTPLSYILDNMEFEILDINLNHDVLHVNELKNIHKDPFDRIIIAQSSEENCVLLTTDKLIKKYFKI